MIEDMKDPLDEERSRDMATVPNEPTPQMMIAGAEAILPTVRGTNSWPENSLIDTARRCYLAMLAATPSRSDGPHHSNR